MQDRNKNTVIDLFCGAGGLSYGFQNAGCRVVLGTDYKESVQNTFLNSHPGAKFLPSMIQELTAERIVEIAELKCAEIDILVGGPPCQGYSVYNHNRGSDDPRAGLFRDYLRLVGEIRPKWIVMENVTGIFSISGGAIINEIEIGLTELDYHVEYKILKSEDYGVAQKRRRVFFIANSIGAPIIFPEPTHGENNNLKPLVSIWDAIGDLPYVGNGQKHASFPNHTARKLSAINIERMRHIPPGGSWRDIPTHLLPNGMKKADRSSHTKRYGRPRKNDLSSTILTKCDPHWGAFIHPTQDRAFTVREAARLQSFPDSTIFHGTQTEQYEQVGNAVPPLMAQAIAKSILETKNIPRGK